MGQIVNRRRVFGSGGGIDYSKQYLTITALEDGFVDFNICDSNSEHGISTDYVTSVSYSTDGGSTWTTRQNTGDVIIIELYLYEGQQVLFKGIANSYYDRTAWGRFQLNASCSASGNIMSLLYGDNFIGQTALPSSTYTFYRMFYNCVGLADIGNLVMPATTLKQGCYERMFQGTAITSLPVNLLPATTLTTYCYNCMFSGCTSLTTVPELPATTVVSSCYNCMFSGCTSLTTVPSDLLPATTLASCCYGSMFNGCSSLTTAPELPATTLVNSCYQNMFYGCSSLTNAPVLPATTLVNYCYYRMFYGCSSLNYIKCLATDISASSCTGSWVNGVAASGTFVMDMFAEFSIGVDGIPLGWDVQTQSMTEYFTIMSLDDSNAIGWRLSAEGGERTIQYSRDKITWTSATSSTSGVTLATLNTGDRLYIKGTNNAYGDQSNNFRNYFTATQEYNVGGNIMSLVFGDNFIGQNVFTSSNVAAFRYLFYNNTHLIKANALSLPATTLSTHVYANMFYGCSSLVVTPELPAVNLSNYCYYSMFTGCTALEAAPALHAPTLAKYSYYYMFRNCASLDSILCLATNISASSCTTGWVYGVASSGTFLKPSSMSSWTTGDNGIPSGWTAQNLIQN